MAGRLPRASTFMRNADMQRLSEQANEILQSREHCISRSRVYFLRREAQSGRGVGPKIRKTSRKRSSMIRPGLT